MYLNYIEDAEIKKSFIAQLYVISKIYNNYFTLQDYDYFNRDDIDSVLSFNIKKSIAEISNLNEYAISELLSFISELEEYISEIVRDNDYDFKEKIVVKKVWKRYSRYLEDIDDNIVKKIIYFELLTITTSTDKKFNSYFKYLRNKLGISDMISKEIDNLVYANASVYKSIRDLVEIG
ncbi:hypothetical protein BFL38_07425 [Brachyspira hampsonii]|uniref:Uncharacterized protein n=1 Tax=Brachyspira hampsonii TaxID=1287055 RepID=A0A1E5NEU6_9SPIR|nr:hypothetical protein [Brachyspira hampsonii]OEJ14665.1 hypothetical protein BFL38_07425 [Brachyspira hampsonii]